MSRFDKAVNTLLLVGALALIYSGFELSNRNTQLRSQIVELDTALTECETGSAIYEATTKELLTPTNKAYWLDVYQAWKKRKLNELKSHPSERVSTISGVDIGEENL